MFVLQIVSFPSTVLLVYQAVLFVPLVMFINYSKDNGKRRFNNQKSKKKSETVNYEKFLGITVDDKLSWKPHIENTCQIISRNIGIINKVKYCFPTSTLFTLYSSLILPYLNYGLLAWGHANSTHIDKLLLLQKKVLRIICNTSFRSPTDVLFFENKILKITDLYLFQLGQFMFKFNANGLPNMFDTMYRQNNAVHNYPTRHNEQYHLPLTRTLLAKTTINFNGPKFWNSLDNEIKTVPTLNSFKYKLKSMLLNAYNNPPTN